MKQWPRIQPRVREIKSQRLMNVMSVVDFITEKSKGIVIDEDKKKIPN